MSSPVSKIKEILSIEDVLSSYIKLEQAGSNMKARCPFHNEKTPSFFVSPDRGTYYCFGCGASGDIFTFVEEFEGLDFKGALKLLADRAGVVLGEYNKEEQDEKTVLYKVMEEAMKYFVSNLSENKKVLNYLLSRGLNEKSIKDFKLGFSKNSWRELYFYLHKKGYKDEVIEKAGLAKRSEKGMYDRFRSRIMFPISDSSGRVIAFSGRIFFEDESQDDGKSAKYLNSPETPIFNKSFVFYGIDKAKDSIRKNNFVILVEGQMDLIMSHQAGFRNTVATSGTSLTDITVSKDKMVSNLGIVRRLTKNIVLAFDSDKAGLNATKRAGKIALSLDMDVKVAKIEEGMDPADIVFKKGEDAWKSAIRGSVHIVEFLLDRVMDTNTDPRKVGMEIKNTVLPFVAMLQSAIDKSFFIKKISDKTGIKERALEEDLEKVAEDSIREKEETEEIESTQNKMLRKDYILRKLLGVVFWQRAKEDAGVDAEKIFSNLKEILEGDENEILKNYESFSEDLIFEAEVFYRDKKDLKKEVEELISNFEEEILREDLNKKMKELSVAEANKNKKRSEELLKECQAITEKIHQFKNKRLSNNP